MVKVPYTARFNVKLLFKKVIKPLFLLPLTSASFVSVVSIGIARFESSLVFLGKNKFVANDKDAKTNTA